MSWSYLPSSWWKISVSRSLSMLHPNMAMKAPEIITCRSATRLQGNVSAKRGSGTGRQVKSCFSSTVLTLQNHLMALAVPRNLRKCYKQTWKVAGILRSFAFDYVVLWMKWSPGATITQVPTCHLRVQTDAGAQDRGDAVTDLQTKYTFKKTKTHIKRLT